MHNEDDFSVTEDSLDLPASGGRAQDEADEEMSAMFARAATTFPSLPAAGFFVSSSPVPYLFRNA